MVLCSSSFVLWFHINVNNFSVTTGLDCLLFVLTSIIWSMHCQRYYTAAEVFEPTTSRIRCRLSNHFVAALPKTRYPFWVYKILYVSHFRHTVVCTLNPKTTAKYQRIRALSRYYSKMLSGTKLNHTETLTHDSIMSFLCDKGKQYSPRCDAVKRDIPSIAILFA